MAGAVQPRCTIALQCAPVVMADTKVQGPSQTSQDPLSAKESLRITSTARSPSASVHWRQKTLPPESGVDVAVFWPESSNSFGRIGSRIRALPKTDTRPFCVGARSSFGVTKEMGDENKSFRIHYNRKDGKYDEWGLHVWGATDHGTTWEMPLKPTGSDGFGVFWMVDAKQTGEVFVLIHSGEKKEPETKLENGTKEVWIISGHPSVFYKEPELSTVPRGNLRFAKAMWVTRSLLAWVRKDEEASYALHASRDATLRLTGKGVEGAQVSFKLQIDPSGLPSSVVEKFPHISDYAALRVPPGVDTEGLVKCQLAVSSVDGSGAPVNATGVQLPGVLDDICAYDGPLGVSFAGDEVTLSVWAPTAQNVRLLLFASPGGGGKPAEAVQMEEGGHGVWRARGPISWAGKYYVYEVIVFHQSTGKIEECHATDPYARALSANGERSFVSDLSKKGLEPEGWMELAMEKPTLSAFTDISIYELHIRDFSIFDDTVDPARRGTYLAFAERDTAGLKHLKNLAEAGMTHLHLLPCFDFASVDEKKENWQSVDADRLSTLPPDSEEQQAAVVAIQDEDGYNWGYDPVNWGVPDGSYACNPNGSARTLEFRTMIQSLNRLGLRVVLDVVYNHLHSRGPSSLYSVLDKVVPGYYLRQTRDGSIENSTCMNNTASEHYMMDRLIVDDLLHWATTYKIDGFRFDLMGHLMRRTMLRAKAALRSLTIEADGVDGSKIYLYGEGWDFGEMANNGRGYNASQRNLAGTGIGTFNDRLRNSVIGGSPFGDPRQQGFLTGVSLQPNELYQGDESATANRLASMTDWIRLGLASNLKDFSFINHLGKSVQGSEIFTGDGVPVAYAASPDETVNYVSAHDNETLFDVVLLKTSGKASLDERCRINHLATSIVALGQGIPFFHAGDDVLRSKSFDRDSYNSGDWFNRLDWTYESNNFGVGLPPKPKNGEKWSIARKLLSNPLLKPTKNQITAAAENLKDLLRIRYSSPLFRLTTGSDVQKRLKFHNTGPAGVPGAIILSIDDGEGGSNSLAQLDSRYRRLVVVFNARPTLLEIQVKSFQLTKLSLHPVQMASLDITVKRSTFSSKSGTLTVPARTTAVFVEVR